MKFSSRHAKFIAAFGLILNSAVFAQENVDCSSASADRQEDSCLASRKSREELASEYPDIDAGSTKQQNPKILCPFLRMLERAGLFDREKETQSALTVGIIKIANAAREFGCSFVACGGVAAAVSTGQLTQFSTKIGKVNLEKLHRATGISHECGLSFPKGGSQIDEAKIDLTLSRLLARTDSESRLQWSDIMAVKLQNCADQGVLITLPGSVEVDLIYTFLGGNERGFIDYEDVVRLFNAELPQTIGTPGVAKVER